MIVRRAARSWAALPAPLQAAACYALAVAAARGLGLALLPLTTAALPPAEFARLELLLSLGEIGGLLLSAGLVDTLYRFVASDGRGAVARTTGLGIALGGAGLLLAAVLAPFGALLPWPATPVEVALLGAAVALDVALGVPLATLRVDGRAGAYAASVALRGILHAGSAALLLLAGCGVAGVLAASATAASATAALLIGARAKRGEVSLSPAGWSRLLAYGAPLTAGGLAAFALGSADRWFLAGAVAPESMAHYALAVKLAMAAAFLTQPFELWWYPRRLALLAQPDGAARTTRAVGIGGALVLLAAGATAAGGPVLIALATPASYHAAGTFVPWLAAALALQSFGSLVNVGCYAGRVAAQPLAVNGASGLAALAGYALLVPEFGVSGAIAATLLAQTVRLLAFHRLSARNAPIRYPVVRLALLALPAAAAGAAPQLLGTGCAGIAAAAFGLAATAALGVVLRLLPTPPRPVSMPVLLHA